MNLMEANEVLEGPQVFSQLEPEVSIDKTDQEIMIMSLPSVPNDLDIETEERFQKQEMRMTSPNENIFFLNHTSQLKNVFTKPQEQCPTRAESGSYAQKNVWLSL